MFQVLLIDPHDNEQTHHRELTVAHVFRFAGACEYSLVIGHAAHSDDPTLTRTLHKGDLEMSTDGLEMKGVIR